MEQGSVVELESARSFHNLESLGAEIRRGYFPDAEALPVRWGQRILRKRRRSIRLGSYNHITKEIRIHPLLDATEVPSYFIQSIIHHEYLHHVFGPNHNRRFHSFERRFRFHREAQLWLRMNLPVLLGRTAKPQPTRPPLRPVVAAAQVAAGAQQQLSLF